MHQVQKQMRLPDFAVLLDSAKSALAASGLNPLGDTNSSTALPPVPAEEPFTAGVRGRVRQRRPVWRWHLQALVDSAWRALLSDKDLHVAVARYLSNAAQEAGRDISVPFTEVAASAALSSLHLRVVVGGGSRLECTQTPQPAPQQVTVETPSATPSNATAIGTAVASTLFRVPSSQEAEGEHVHPRAGCRGPLHLPAVAALTRSAGNDKASGHFGAPAAKHRHLDKRHVLGGLKVEERKLRRQRADAAAREKARQSELLRAAARDARAAVPMGGASLRSASGSLLGQGGAGGVPASPMAHAAALRRGGGSAVQSMYGSAAATPSTTVTTAGGLVGASRHLQGATGVGGVLGTAGPGAGVGTALRASASGPALGVARPRLQLGKALGGSDVSQPRGGPSRPARAVAAAPRMPSGATAASASAPSLAAPMHVGRGMPVRAREPAVAAAGGGAGGGDEAPRSAQRWGLARR